MGVFADRGEGLDQEEAERRVFFAGEAIEQGRKGREGGRAEGKEAFKSGRAQERKGVREEGACKGEEAGGGRARGG